MLQNRTSKWDPPFPDQLNSDVRLSHKMNCKLSRNRKYSLFFATFLSNGENFQNNIRCPGDEFFKTTAQQQCQKFSSKRAQI